MDEFFRILEEELASERKFYAEKPSLWEVEQRALAALSVLLIKVQGRLEAQRSENEEN
jgi:hypothetical protein